MKLAEALIERADLQKRVERLNARIATNALFQEGDAPAEDPGELIVECQRLLVRLRDLITQINLTNSRSVAPDGRLLTALLAERERLKGEYSLLSKAADAAGPSRLPRQLRSELRQVTTLSVPTLRSHADRVAADLRRVDVLLQRANWEVDLLEG